MGIKEDAALVQELFDDTHAEGETGQKPVTMADMETLMKGFVTQAGAPVKEEQEPDAIGIKVECAHCKKMTVVDGIDGDEIIKAINTTLGTFAGDLSTIVEASGLNETILKGVAGIIKDNEALHSEIDEIKKSFTGTKLSSAVDSKEEKDEPETEPEKKEEDLIAKGVVMDLGSASPDTKDFIKKAGELSREGLIGIIKKACDSGEIPPETLGEANSTHAWDDLMNNSNICSALEKALG